MTSAIIGRSFVLNTGVFSTVLALVVAVPFVTTAMRGIRATSNSVGTASVAAVPGYAPSGGLEVRLDRIVYPEGSSISATVTVEQRPPAEALQIYLVAPDSKDVEIVKLQRTSDPTTFVTERALPITLARQGPAQKQDGRLTLQPNETFLALFTANPQVKGAPVVGDFGLLEDRQFKKAQLQIVPGIDVRGEDKPAAPGKTRFGTVHVAGGLPVQIPVDELIVYPRSAKQLDQLMLRTSGRAYLRDLVPGKGGAGPKGTLVKVSTTEADLAHLPQMRALLGQTGTLYASSQEALKVVALAIQYQLDGVAATLNPRFFALGAPAIHDGSNGAPWPTGRPEQDGGALDAMSADSLSSPTVDRDTIFGVRRAWAYLALFDKDTRRVPTAFLDNGFAPSPDFRGYDPAHPENILQCNMESGLCASGSAVGAPTIGAGYFGPHMWHGNGVVSAAGAVLNNGWGGAGTGGQVLVPRLYSLGPTSYFQMANAIIQATDGGADAINISAGLLCGVPTDLGVLDICNPGGRVALCAFLHGRMLAAAGLLGLIPFIGPFLVGNAIAAADLAFGACTTSSFLLGAVGYGDRMAYAVDYAQSRGVTIVAAAGNSWGLDPTLATAFQVAGGVNVGDNSADDWRIIPCTLTGVICVGGANPITPYGNGQWFGNRVDVWAPQGSTYYAPHDIDAVVPPASEVAYSDARDGCLYQGDAPRKQGFWGTSGATAFTTGVVAMMIAVNPNLDRANASLNNAARAAIPGRIRQLLVSTATPRAALPVDPTGQRRNLINAIRAVQGAARADNTIPDISALGFPTDFGFDEANPTLAQNDHLETAVTIGAMESRSGTGTILTLPAEPPAGVAFSDTDWYKVQAPAEAHAAFSGGRIELRYLRGFGQLRLNGGLGTECLGTTTVECRQFTIPDLPGGATYAARITAPTAVDDNVYRITFSPATRRLSLADAVARPVPGRTPPPLPIPDPRAPTVAIVYPTADVGLDNPAYGYDGYLPVARLWYKDVALQGIAVDAQKTALAGAAMVWTTDRTDIPGQQQILGTGTRPGTGTPPKVRLYSNVCTGVTHRVTLTATDRDEHAASAVRTIRIWQVC
jgi:subtilase family protein